MDGIDDVYTEPVHLGGAGENLLTFAEDGSATLSRKLPEERPTGPTGRAKVAIQQAGDEMIERVADNALGIYYRIGQKITVRGGSGDHWLCLTCTGPDRYETSEHEGCVHIQRVKRWASDHPMEAAA
jgi:hypothetical protein